MRVALHQDGLVAALKDVPGPSVLPVEALRIDAVQVTHAA